MLPPLLLLLANVTFEVAASLWVVGEQERGCGLQSASTRCCHLKSHVKAQVTCPASL
jgi:hypothetical protein